MPHLALIAAVLTGLAWLAPASAADDGIDQVLIAQAPCPPGYFLQRGQCVERPRMGPGTNPGAGTGWVTGLPGYELTMCQWSHFDQSYVFCPIDGRRNPPRQ